MQRVDIRERRRVETLHNFGVLNAPENESFNRIARVAAKLFDLPMAAVSFVQSDHQRLQSNVGFTGITFPRVGSPCADVVKKAEVLAISDLKDHPVYSHSLLHHVGARSYAGAPLLTQDGNALGALFVMGYEPRAFSSDELLALTDLSTILMSQLELQYALVRTDQSSRLPNKNQFLQDLNDSNGMNARKKRTAALVDLVEPSQLENLRRAVTSPITESFVRSAAIALNELFARKRKLYHVGPTQVAYLMPAALDEAKQNAELHDVIRVLMAANVSETFLSPCAGVMVFRPVTTEPLDVLRGLNGAVQDGRECSETVSFYSHENDGKHRRRFEILRAFPLALSEADQLSIVFQPRIDLIRSKVVSAEVLLRWQHPTLATISPAEFIPIIENSVHSEALTAWVLEAALCQMRIWSDQGLSVPLSVNISASNLHDDAFVKSVFEALSRHAIPSAMLELEVTESSVMRNPTRAAASLNLFAAGGVNISIDDFGTGYSSLGYLQKFPLNAIKIDRSFVNNVANEPKNQKLIELIVKLARGFDHQVVVEGVETVEDLNLLKKIGCHQAQGYLFSRPLAADAFREYMFSAWGTDPVPKTSKRTFFGDLRMTA